MMGFQLKNGTDRDCELYALPGKKFLERVRNAQRNRANQILVSWNLTESDVIAKSVSSYNPMSFVKNGVPDLEAMKNLLIESCETCQLYRPSLAKAPMMSDPPPTRPFESVSADLFEFGGKWFLALVDQFSGWPCCDQYGKTPNTQEVVRARYDVGAVTVPKFAIGDRVRIQNPITKLWDRVGRIHSKRNGGRSFVLKIGSRWYVRNRRYLRPILRETA
ncbi:hypothetical protein TCAL_16431, partial [Tigriopus californicus]